MARIYLDTADARNLNGAALNSAILQWDINLPEPIKNGKICVEQVYVEVAPPAGGNIFKIMLHGLSGENCFDSTNRSREQVIYTSSFGGAVSGTNLLTLPPRIQDFKVLADYIPANFQLTLRFQTLRILTNINRIWLVLSIESE